jgi:tRNA A37 methylthiotransferase MiaB
MSLPKIHLINPAHVCSGFAIMTPRWLAVIAGATPASWQERLRVHDLSLDELDLSSIDAGDLVGISLHTLNARRAYELIREIKSKSQVTVVAGGVHTTIFPDEVLDQGADAVVVGDGDHIWSEIVADYERGSLKRVYEGGRVASSLFVGNPLWRALDHSRYMMATVQTTRGCPENCTFCSVWRTDGREVRFRTVDDTIREVRDLYDLGFRLIVLADDNFYAVGSKNESARASITTERMELMRRLADETPPDVTYLTQTTIRTADDPEFMAAMKRARIRAVLVGIESIDEKTLAAIHKSFNKQGFEIAEAVKRLQSYGIFVLGSHIVGLGSDDGDTYPMMLSIAKDSGMFLAQFVLYTCFPGTVDYEMMTRGKHSHRFKPGYERYWLLDTHGEVPNIHPTMSEQQLLGAVARLWGSFYTVPQIIRRGWRLGLKSPTRMLTYLIFSQFYKRVYYGYGMAADSVRTVRAGRLTRWLGRLAIRALKGSPGRGDVVAEHASSRPTVLTGADGPQPLSVLP